MSDYGEHMATHNAVVQARRDCESEMAEQDRQAVLASGYEGAKILREILMPEMVSVKLAINFSGNGRKPSMDFGCAKHDPEKCYAVLGMGNAFGTRFRVACLPEVRAFRVTFGWYADLGPTRDPDLYPFEEITQEFAKSLCCRFLEEAYPTKPDPQ